ncbi:MAG TPA: tRNA (adenosine(37)-N6)-dimethylallyltransferase MiaA [Gemmatimonadaceae bacterium]|nr:tRNA (adenosine(37)-N6)-dimethylallyltransferase MiaA [Gemmatimonadaceae bacterium]
MISVICGPTASGKTRAALRLATVAPVEIISADSRQLYRDFDVGTAKPSAAERAAVAHHGIDVLDPTERASAAWWAEHADAWIREVVARGRSPVVVGGTGLYLRALFGALFEEPPMDVERRRSLEDELAPLDTAELRRRVAALDPARAHLGRTQLLRAIEVALLTGHRLSDLQRERATLPRWRARYLVLDPGPSLSGTIAARTRAMFAAGWRDEVRHLMSTVPDDAPAWNASGYPVVRELERGMLSPEAAMERVIIETRQYAKRQRTWFRHQLADEDVTRLDPAAASFDDALRGWWRAGTGEEGA